MSQSPNIFDPNQIVEPGRSDKAAFDRETYVHIMRGGGSTGFGVKLVVTGFAIGFVLAFLIALGLNWENPQRYALIVGVLFGGAATFLLIRFRQGNRAQSIDLQAQAHDLELKAKQLEVELAKKSGAFDKWDKSQ